MKSVYIALVSAALGLALFSTASAMPAGSGDGGVAKRDCRRAKYRLTLANVASRNTFPFLPQPFGVVFSPFVVAVHDPRLTVFRLRGGLLSDPVRLLAEQGGNVALRNSLRKSPLVKSVDVSNVLTLEGSPTVMEVDVDCRKNRVSFIAQVAPSPDWFVGHPGLRTFRLNPRTGRREFIKEASSTEVVYDGGTDKGPATGSIFTPPGLLEFDRPENPQLPVRRLGGSSEDPGFRSKPVMKWKLELIE